MGLEYLPTFTYIYHRFMPNVGKYTSPMDPMGMRSHQMYGNRDATLEEAVGLHVSKANLSRRRSVPVVVGAAAMSKATGNQTTWRP